MVDPEENINKWQRLLDFIARNGLAFILGALIGGSAITAFYERFRLPGLQAQVDQLESHVEQLKSMQAPQLSRAADTTSDTADRPEQTAAKFDFELDSMGWRSQDQEQIQGCSRVDATAKQRHRGSQSLEMTLSIDGTDASRSRGEAFGKIRGRGPAGEELPLDLSGRTISAWVYAPRGSSGPSDNPNGLQLFVKDATFKSLYGPWTQVEEGTWMPLQLRVSATAESSGHVDPGFDPARLVVVGVKFAAGGNSTATYEGPIYVDDVDW